MNAAKQRIAIHAKFSRPSTTAEPKIASRVLARVVVESEHAENNGHAARAIETFVIGKVDEGWRICAAHT